MGWDQEDGGQRPGLGGGRQGRKMGEAHEDSPADPSPLWGCAWWVKINLRLSMAETGLSLGRQNPGVTEKVVEVPEEGPASFPPPPPPMHVTFITLFY